MAEEIAFKYSRISNFEGLLTLDRVTLNTVVHHSSTYTYMPNFIEIEETFLDGRTYGQKDEHLRPALLGRLCPPKKWKMYMSVGDEPRGS